MDPTLAERILWIAVLANLAWFALCLTGLALDRRHLHGENVWAKPARFAPSLALHYATMALAVSLLSPDWRGGSAILAAAAVGAAALAFQMAFIGVQAARGQPSHHNESTRFLRICSYAMALCAILVTWPPAIAGMAALLDPGFAGGEALRWGLGIGLVSGAALTTWTAFHLAINKGPFVSARPRTGARIPLLGWSTEVGDLRAIHFLATHAIPLTALAATLAAPAAAVPLTLAAAAIWICGTLWLYRATVAGRPITAPFAPAAAPLTR